jgi:dipeptidyl-peptidase-4
MFQWRSFPTPNKRKQNNMRKTTRLLLLFIFLISTVSVLAQDKLLTIDDIFDPVKRVRFSGTPTVGLRWANDGKSYFQVRADESGKQILMIVDAISGKASPFFDVKRMEEALAKLKGFEKKDVETLSAPSGYHFNNDRTALLFNHKSDLFYYDIETGVAKQLTNNTAAEVEEDFSPDGKSVSFVRGNNLFVVDIVAAREKRLTRDGGEKILNGYLDWVYEEELYGRGNKRGYWWSPDSSAIAFLRMDETPVPKFVVVDHIPLRQTIEDTPYPKAGDPNPLVKLGIANVKNGVVRFVDTTKYKPEDSLVVRVDWSPDAKRVVYQMQNREQTFLDLNAADARGKSTNLFQEKTPAWVDVNGNPFWLEDGSFLWESARTGWKHLYHYSGDGKLIRQITNGKWEVRNFVGVDETSGYVYFTATEHSHIAEQAYRIKLDGSGLQRITQNEGHHSVNFNPTFTHFFDTWSDINTPQQTRLFKSDGTLERMINENKVEVLKQYKLGKPEFLKVKTRDGFEMEALMIKPADFDASKKYPVMSFTYSGPHAPQVRNAWGGNTLMWYHLLTQRGYIIWVCDNRSASGKGAESEWEIYKKFGVLELQDLEDGVSYLKSLPYIDASRIGLSGWSFGGFMTSYALTHSTSFKIGIAGGSVTDWHLYDSIYTERYMMTPQNNPDGYKITSVINAAKDLNGKLLLVHGAIDENVHAQNTIKLAYELQKASKQFQLMLYPKNRHGIADPIQLKQMRQMMTDFILANL